MAGIRAVGVMLATAIDRAPPQLPGLVRIRQSADHWAVDVGFKDWIKEQAAEECQRQLVEGS